MVTVVGLPTRPNPEMESVITDIAHQRQIRMDADGFEAVRERALDILGQHDPFDIELIELTIEEVLASTHVCVCRLPSTDDQGP
ncbi:MAG: hypothetical protein ACRCYU_12045 [Nocardioides sp.]